MGDVYEISCRRIPIASWDWRLPSLAHHSHANYDITTWLLLEGTVKRVVFIAPHSLIYLDVKDEHGDTATWALEATAPAGIFGNGVKREDVLAGDKIKARCHILRDGGNGCLLGFVTPAARRRRARRRRGAGVGLSVREVRIADPTADDECATVGIAP